MVDSGETGQAVVIRTWEVCSVSKHAGEVFPNIAEQIVAGQKLGLTWVSLETRRNDHFMHGGNVVKGRCTKYVLILRSGEPPKAASSSGEDRG